MSNQSTREYKVSLFSTVQQSEASKSGNAGDYLEIKGGVVEGLRVRFEVIAADDAQQPNRAVIRIYNLADQTINNILNTFNKSVILEAGFKNQSATIFFGDVKQITVGKEGNIDRFLDIEAADGDITYNQKLVSYTVSNAVALDEALQKVIAAAGAEYDTDNSVIATTAGFGGTLPRAKVLFGYMKDVMRQYSKTLNCTWSIQDGQIVFTSLGSYLLNGEEVVLNGETGLIGYPKADTLGVHVTCLLNPLISLGTVIRLDNHYIQQTYVIAQGARNYGAINFPAVTSTDGRYRVQVVEYVGDTRGDAWYCNLICLAIHPDRPFQTSVGGV